MWSGYSVHLKSGNKKFLFLMLLFVYIEENNNQARKINFITWANNPNYVPRLKWAFVRKLDYVHYKCMKCWEP